MNRPATAAPHLPALLTAAFAGAIVLAFGDAPQSIGLVFTIGIDEPGLVGEQLAVALAGALATALSVLFADGWRWLLPAGALGVLVSRLMFNPDLLGVTARAVTVDGSETQSVPVFVRELPWMCLGVASAGMLLVGVLGAAQRLYRERPAGAAAAAVVGCAAYLGASVVGPLRGADMGTARLVVLGLAVLLTGAVLFSRETADPAGELALRPRLLAAVAVALTVVPTVLVAVTGESAIGTWQGGLVGLLLLGAAVFAALGLGQNALLATAAVSLTLAGLAMVMVFMADALTADPSEYAQGVFSVLAVVAAAVLACLRGRLTIAAVVLAVTALLLLAVAAGILPDVSALLVLLIVMCVASVGLAVGSTAPFFALRNALPAAGAVITTMALGVHMTLHFLRIGGEGRPNAYMVWGAGGFIVAAVVVLAAAGLLVLLRRLDRVRTTGPGDDYRRILTTTGPVPPETP